MGSEVGKLVVIRLVTLTYTGGVTIQAIQAAPSFFIMLSIMPFDSMPAFSSEYPIATNYYTLCD